MRYKLLFGLRSMQLHRKALLYYLQADLLILGGVT